MFIYMYVCMYVHVHVYNKTFCGYDNLFLMIWLRLVIFQSFLEFLNSWSVFMDVGTPGPVEPDRLVNVSRCISLFSHRTLNIQGSMLELNRPSVLRALLFTVKTPNDSPHEFIFSSYTY